MTGSRWLAGALAAVALAAAGCGGDDDEETGGRETGTEQAAPQTDTGGLEDNLGKDTFAATCGGCHTLKAAGTSGQTGPNLDDLKPDVERVKEAIREGPGIMPENLVRGAEADAVAAFVAESAGS